MTEGIDNRCIIENYSIAASAAAKLRTERYCKKFFMLKDSL
jgi:hypothetical protein